MEKTPTLADVKARAALLFGEVEAVRLLASRIPFWWPDKATLKELLAEQKYKKVLELFERLEESSHTGMPRSGHAALAPARLFAIVAQNPEITDGAPFEGFAHCRRHSDFGYICEMWLVRRRDGVVWEVGGDWVEAAEPTGSFEAKVPQTMELSLLNPVELELVEDYAHWVNFWGELFDVWQRGVPGREPDAIRTDIANAWSALTAHIPSTEIAAGVNLPALGTQFPV
jgi:hypothetical protein